MSGRAAGCTVLHVDMDAFFASVEVRRPARAGRHAGDRRRRRQPRGGHLGHLRGPRATACTARCRRPGRCGCARRPRCCPATWRSTPRSPGRSWRCSARSRRWSSRCSLDEAFLDVAGAGRRLGDPAAIGEYIRARVFDEQGITCSVGVAGTKFVAKLASTRSKPDGLLVVRPAEVMDFLHPLPVGALWGVGAKTEEELLRLGLRTVGDLAARAGQDAAAGARARPRARTCTSWPGGATRAGWCPTSRRGRPGARRPSAPTSTTRRSSTASCCGWPSGRRAGCARAAGSARTVSIKVRFADFATITRSRTLDVPTDVGQELYDTARALFDALGLDRARIRLVGVRAERLVEAEVRAAAARARRPRARPAGRRAGRRPRGPPVRCRRGAAGDPAAPRRPPPPVRGRQSRPPAPGAGRERPAGPLTSGEQSRRPTGASVTLAFRTLQSARILGGTVGGLPPAALAPPTWRSTCRSPSTSSVCWSRSSAPSSTTIPSSPRRSAPATAA